MLKSFFLLMIELYRLILSPLIGHHCRFHPSCSVYAKQCIEIHGVCQGAWLTIKRLLRCQPWGGHGFDPPPENIHLSKGQ